VSFAARLSALACKRYRGKIASGGVCGVSGSSAALAAATSRRQRTAHQTQNRRRHLGIMRYQACWFRIGIGETLRGDIEGGWRRAAMGVGDGISGGLALLAAKGRGA